MGTYQISSVSPMYVSTMGVIDQRSGDVWIPSEAPLPAGFSKDADDRLSSVTCVSAGSCLAVGFLDTYTDAPPLIVSVARLTVRPASGDPGETVTANASGFFGSESISVHWKSASGVVLATTTTNSSGFGTVSFQVPTVTPGDYKILAVGSDGPTASAMFKVG